MFSHSQALEDARSQLYTVFAPYSTIQHTTNWFYNLSNHTTLASTPLIELTISDLTPLVKELAFRPDADQLLRHYLPRILDICSDGYHQWSIGLEIVFSSLACQNWQAWSEQEQRTIETYLRALWLYHLSDISPTGTTSSADSLLEAIGRVMDVQPFLDVWDDVNTTHATAHIASLTVYGKKHLKRVRQWLSQPTILRRIEAAFWDCGNSNHAAMYAKAAEYLRLGESLIPA